MKVWKLQSVVDKTEWEALVAGHSEANFLQSWNWGAFHQHLGKKVNRFIWAAQSDIHGQSTVDGIAQVVLERARRGSYLTVAGGPLLDWKNQALVKQVLSDLKIYADKLGARFVRFRPQIEATPSIEAMIRSQVGVVAAPMHVTADLTLQLDLQQSSDQLLAGMRKNTRYEIRRAEKMGIVVRQSVDEQDIDRMYQDQLWLAQHHGFVPFQLDFWKEQFRAFVTDQQVALFHAYHQDQLLASAFIIFYNGEAVYHYGTSTPANARLPGSYACQWAAVLEAQRRGCVRYNMWGVAPPEQKNHRFAGVSIFKRGFGGREIQYVPAHDLVVNWQYWPIALFEQFRKKLRRL